MPSPVGHVLAGLAVAWSAESISTPLPPTTEPARGRLSPTALALVCAGLAALADADLLVPGMHRRASHSIVAAIIVFIVAAGVTRWVTGRVGWKVAALCFVAYASHLVLDWMGEDFNPPRGIELLWPFSDRRIFSGWDLFLSTERRRIFSAASIATNLRAVAREIAIVGPVAALAWLVRRKARATRS